MIESISVLHVEDDPTFADLTATFLRREDDRFSVKTAADASEGFDRLADEGFDCIVSDYDMPGKNGIEFLKGVREIHPDLPFILFTGKGSEEVASDAISAGATDYMQKGGADQYALLANRIQNIVEQYRNKQRRERLERIRATVNDINQMLVRASSRQEIETQVCDILAEVEPDRFAAFMKVDSETKRIEPQTWSGTDKAFLINFEMSVAEGSPGRQTPGGRAFHEREIAVAQNIQTDPTFEHWRELAVEHGFYALAVVPLAYESEFYGLLAVFAGRPHAFDEIEQEVLAELGGDITHALAALDTREDLRSEKERFRLLAESARDAIVTINSDSIVTFANSAVEDLFGYTPDALVGESLTMLMPKRYRDRHLDAITRFLETQERKLDWANIELPGLQKNGQEIDLSITFAKFEQDGEQYFEGIIRDITERKDREQELEQYETITETIRDGICVLNRDSQFVLVNVAFVELTNYSRDELLGAHASLVRPEELDETFDEIQDALNTGSNIESIEMEIERADGSRRVIDARYAPYTFNGDAGRVGVWRDITDQKHQNDRLEEFAKVVSHDLRNPLNVAEGRLELAQEECESEHLDSAANAVARSEALVENLLTLAREGTQVGDTELVDLGEMAESCWQTVPTAEATLVTDTDRTLQAGPSGLQQLLENLFRNAVKHGNGIITITVGDLVNGFYVADDGTGIPEDKRDEVFNAGYTTTNKGSGFGLSIVKQVVEAHGWDIRVTDSEDGGVRFEFFGVNRE